MPAIPSTPEWSPRKPEAQRPELVRVGLGLGRALEFHRAVGFLRPAAGLLQAAPRGRDIALEFPGRCTFPVKPLPKRADMQAIPSIPNSCLLLLKSPKR